MKKIVLGSLALILILSSCITQPPMRAQKKMNLFNYTRAVKILKKSVTKPKYYDQSVPLLAECYKMQHDYENSLYWYEKAAALPAASLEWNYQYSLSLINMGYYEKAKDAFAKYLQSKPEDKKAAEKMKQCDVIVNDWKLRPTCFEIKTLDKINSPASDFGPAFYSNGFTFATDRGKNLVDDDVYGWTGRNYLKIMFSKPKAPGKFFGEFREPTQMNTRFNQSFHDGPVAFAGDSIAMFTRTYKDPNSKKAGGIKTDYLKIYSTKRVRGDWQSLEPFPYNSLDFSVGHPAISADGQTLYFSSDMPGGYGGVDLWKCKKEGNGWSKPVNLGNKVNTPGNEMFPTLKYDGTLYFSSDGLPGYGGLDIFSTYPDKEGFAEPENLMAPINSSFDDFSMAWFPGTNYGMFSSDRPGGKGLDDIYAFKKLPGEPQKIVKKEVEPKPARIWGIVKDKVSGKPLKDAIVFVLNEKSDTVNVISTDSDGIFRLTMNSKSNVIIKATYTNFIPDCLTWVSDSIREGEDNKAPKELLLSKLEVNKTFKLENIYYDFDKFNIRPDAEPALDALVNIMKENPITIELSSHTDCRGSFAYNDKLSLRRAESAVNYLVANGVEASRLTFKGYGEHQLVNKCADGVPCTAAEHQANRRTEFRVTSFTEPKEPLPGTFNPVNFKPGEKISREALPADFFMQCQ